MKAQKTWAEIKKEFRPVSNPDDLHVGQVIYLIRALGKQSFAEIGVITRRPYVRNLNGDKVDWMDVTTLLECSDHAYKGDMSLHDCNVIANSYNYHLLFLDRNDAIRYLLFCKENHWGRVMYDWE